MRAVFLLAASLLLAACQPAAEAPEIGEAPVEAPPVAMPSSTFHQALAAMSLTPETASGLTWEEFRQDGDRAVFTGVSGQEDGNRWTAESLIIFNPRLEGEQPLFDRWEIAGYKSELGGGAAFDSMSLTGPNPAYAESLTRLLADQAAS